ncbi:unnamed protein product [Parnassius apollo]|uniref:(apollo) hypothetical protein n=1 Tax=Parnassius apollo TaxID=110799 RepID=A0A8S3WQY3_PARAO|nr:unnamed protein product [Parnassius apollo]
MNATYAHCVSSCLLTLFISFLLLRTSSASVAHESTPRPQDELPVRKIKVYDGVYVEVPKGNDTRKLLSFEIQTSNDSETETGRGKKQKSSMHKKLMQKLLPMFIMPFLIQSTIVPFFLSILKFMLLKSLMVGKLALALIVLNAFKNSNSFKGRHDAEIANVHYGYHGNGMEEYGAYIN